jgi:hypothetical protein
MAALETTKMKKVNRRFFAFSSFIFCLFWLSSNAHASEVSKCLGKICLGDPAFSYMNAKKSLGKPISQGAEVSSLFTRALCYWIPEKNTSLILGYSSDAPEKDVRLDGILLTSEHLCQSPINPKVTLSPLVAWGNISIGSSEESVIQHGAPSRLNPVNSDQPNIFGQKTLFYDEGANTLLFNQFGISNGVVTAIWFNNSP